MRAYSQDLRERILGAWEAREEAQAEIAERFAVSLSLVEKLGRRWRRPGRVEAFPHAGGRRRQWQGGEARVRAAVNDAPDVPLATWCERGAEVKGVQVSAKTRWLALQRLRLPRKKSRPRLGNARRRG